MDGAVGEVGGDDVARLEVMNGSDGLTVLGEEAVALAVDTLGVTSVEALLEEFDAVLSEEELAFLGALQSEDEVGDAKRVIALLPLCGPLGITDRVRATHGVLALFPGAVVFGGRRSIEMREIGLTRRPHGVGYPSEESDSEEDGGAYSL